MNALKDIAIEAACKGAGYVAQGDVVVLCFVCVVFGAAIGALATYLIGFRKTKA